MNHEVPPDIPTKRSTVKGRIQMLLAGLTLTLLALLLAICNPTAVERLNNAAIDSQVALLPKTSLSNLPVIVEVDEPSLANYGQWPWPRYQVARLLATILESGAIAIGVDALFAEKDRTSPIAIQHMVEQDLQQKLPLNSINESLRDYDAILGQTIKNGPFVLSYLFTFEKPDDNACQPKSAIGARLTSRDNATAPSLYQASGTICNVSPIQEAATSGFINTSSDSDGIYRKTPLVIEYKGSLYPSLALQTFLTAQRQGQFLVANNENGLNLRLGKLTVPLDKAGNLLIKFPAIEQGFKRISAHDLLSGQMPRDYLRGKIVFVGVSAVGLHEVRPTPYNPELLGVEYHAAIVDNLVRNDFLKRPENALALELTISAAIGIGLFVALATSGIAVSVAIPCLLIAGLLAASQLILRQTGMVISPALPVMMSLLAFLGLTLIKYAKEFLRSKALALQVSRSQEGIIGSFCSMSEYRDPETGAHLLRTQAYVKALALHLREHPKFKPVLTDEVIEHLFKAAPLHDIGKIGIRDHILLKKGKLDDDEFSTMQSHPQIGADMIASVAAHTGWNPFLVIAQQISLYHQEKWDGSGYPHGLAGEDIPYPARFMALADVYDALISKRVYKPAFSHNKAVRMILEGKGKHFDPLIVDAFGAIHGQFRDIALRFLDSDDQRDTLLKADDNSN